MMRDIGRCLCRSVRHVSLPGWAVVQPHPPPRAVAACPSFSTSLLCEATAGFHCAVAACLRSSRVDLMRCLLRMTKARGQPQASRHDHKGKMGCMGVCMGVQPVACCKPQVDVVCGDGLRMRMTPPGHNYISGGRSWQTTSRSQPVTAKNQLAAWEITGTHSPLSASPPRLLQRA